MNGSSSKVSINNGTAATTNALEITGSASVSGNLSVGGALGSVASYTLTFPGLTVTKQWCNVYSVGTLRFVDAFVQWTANSVANGGMFGMSGGPQWSNISFGSIALKSDCLSNYPCVGYDTSSWSRCFYVINQSGVPCGYLLCPDIPASGYMYFHGVVVAY